MRENTDEKNSEYGHFSCDVCYGSTGSAMISVDGKNYLYTNQEIYYQICKTSKTKFVFFFQYKKEKQIIEFQNNDLQSCIML